MMSKMNYKIRDNGIKFIKEKGIKTLAALLLAKRRSGKTFFCKHLLYELKDWYDEAYLFYGSYDVDKESYDCFPDLHIFHPDNVDAMEEIWRKQEQYINNVVSLGMDKKEMKHILIVFDDFITADMRRQAIFRKIFTQGRHINMACVAISQCIGGRGGIEKECRENSDFIIAWNPRGEYDRNLLAEQFLSQTEHGIKGAYALITQVTRDSNFPYRCMIIDNTSNFINFEDFVYQDTANPDIPKFKIGESAIFDEGIRTRPFNPHEKY